MTEAAAAPVDRALVRRAFVFAALVFVCMRLTLSLLGLGVGRIAANLPAPVPGTGHPATPGVHNLVDGLDRLDATWFELIADQGYDVHPSTGAFFPGYPLAIRAVSAVPGVSTLAAALLISNLATFGSFAALYVLTTVEFSEQTAKRAVILLAAFPTSFFLVAPYSESLYLLLVLGSFLAARRSRWLTAGATGALACATRQVGVVLVPALLVAAWGRGRRALVAPVLAALGTATYLIWWVARAGDLLAPFHSQDLWGRELGFPPVTLARGFYLAWASIGSSDGGYWMSDAVLTLIAVAGVITVLRRIPASIATFAVLSLLVPLCFPYPGRDLLSMSRFVVVIFPMVWGIARWTDRRWVFVTWLAVSIPLALWHAMLFMHYRHIY